MKKIFSYIFIFIFVFLTCYFNVSAISLRNYGGIKGYEYNGTNSYNCHGYATGVIQIGDEYGNDYFCIFLKEKDKELPYFASKISDIAQVQVLEN